MVHRLWRQFPTVQAQLTALEPYLLNSVQIHSQPIDQRVHQLLTAGGKFLRPGLFYLFSAFGSQQEPARLQAGAAATELLHLATLIHDDVIDSSPLRRHVPTINADHGSRTAIYAGDLLFTCYFDQVIASARSTADITRNTVAMRAILQGELDQMQANFQVDQTIDDYLKIVAGKTARLFVLSCEQGAILAEAPVKIQQLAAQIGHDMGLAYQVLDDILDYTGTPAMIAKPVLEDVPTGVYSAPLLYALQQNPTALKPLLQKKQAISQTELHTLRDLVIKNHGVTAAQKLAAKYTHQAESAIAALPDQPAKQALEKLLAQLLERQQ